MEYKKLSLSIDCFRNSYRNNKDYMILGKKILFGLRCDNKILDPHNFAKKSNAFLRMTKKSDFTKVRVHNENVTDGSLHYSGTRMELTRYKVAMVS